MQHNSLPIATASRRRSPARILLVVLAAALGAVALVGCGSDSDGAGDGPAAGTEAAAAALTEERVVIDVRTPEEYAERHVDDARLIDIQDASFAGEIASLDPDTDYVVYCRTGNRSARAATQMRDIGLDVLDGGGLDDMVEAGWPTA